MARFYWLVNVRITDLKGKASAYIYIPSGSGFSEVKRLLMKADILRHPYAFEWLSRQKHYTRKVKPGRYLITDGMPNEELVNLLRSGKQAPVRITIQNLRTAEDLAGKLGKSLETDSVKFSALFSDSSFLVKFGLTKATLLVLFVPDTYEFFWNTSGEALFRRMNREFHRFWNEERRKKADSLKLSIDQVVTLASIVEKETNKADEKPVMAGVYYNRLHRNIPLQADPTVIFAWNDYSIKRVLHSHLFIRSPYNTYLYRGLPPGPICIPSVESVDAVLHLQKNRYLYFCAREDRTGYHNFAETLQQHNRNAKKYQQALNRMNIMH
jgi:UPF0755 protein